MQKELRERILSDACVSEILYSYFRAIQKQTKKLQLSSDYEIVKEYSEKFNQLFKEIKPQLLMDLLCDGVSTISLSSSGDLLFKEASEETTVVFKVESSCGTLLGFLKKIQPLYENLIFSGSGVVTSILQDEGQIEEDLAVAKDMREGLCEELFFSFDSRGDLVSGEGYKKRISKILEAFVLGYHKSLVLYLFAQGVPFYDVTAEIPEC